jgi:acetyl esterase
MRENKVKRALRQGGVALGTMVFEFNTTIPIRSDTMEILKRIALVLLFAGWVSMAPSKAQQAQATRPALPPPDVQNASYGPHERNVLDLWKAHSAQPTPLVLFIHGGGFRNGDKTNLDPKILKAYLDAGFSVAAINYRFTTTAPAPAAYLDCGRALQFLRLHAKEWHLDSSRVASTGGSAGAGTSLWLAFHDDLAQPQSPDPVARQSTRLTCVAVDNGQSSYDPRFAEKIGLPRPNFERHEFFLPFYDIKAEEIDTPRAYKRYEEFAPITYLSRDDPPALLSYNFPNEEVGPNTPLGVILHHPKFGLALKERMDALGIECTVQFLGQVQPQVSAVDFIRKHFDTARRSSRQDARTPGNTR